MDLEYFAQDPELQSKLDRAANRAIEKAFAEFNGTDTAELIEARLAVKQDELEIQKLFSRYPMHMAGFDLIYDRSPSFFSLLHARGSASVALTGGMKGSSELMGLGSLSVRDGFLNGKRTRVAYLGDLRVIPHRKTFRLWRSMYSRLIEEVAKDLNVESFLTAILGENAMALRSLVERRNSDFLYESIGQMRMINLFSGFGLLKDPSAQGRFKGELVTDEEFSAFYEKEAPHIRHGLAQAPRSGLAVLVRNQIGSTVLGARLVSPDRDKRMRIANADGKMRVFLKTIDLCRGHFSRSADRALSTAYLSFVTFSHGTTPVDRRHAMSELIETCYRADGIRAQLKDKTMLAVPDSVGLSLRELGGRLHQSTGVEIFEVRSKASAMSSQSDAGLNTSVQSIGFEMALV